MKHLPPKLETYIQFLVGQEFMTPYGVLLLNGLDLSSPYKAWFYWRSGKRGVNEQVQIEGYSGKSFWLTEIKPLLRPVEEVTDEELMKFHGVNKRSKSKLELDSWLWYLRDQVFKTDRPQDPTTFHLLVTYGFDVFNLIPSGIAMHRNLITDKPPQYEH